MSIEPIAPAATPTPAQATPASAAVTTPVPDALKNTQAPASTTAPAKTLLEQAGTEAGSTADQGPDEVMTAIEAYKDDPSEENKLAMEKAVGGVKKSASDALALQANSAPPEKYEMTPSDGQSIDEALLADVTPIFKEAGLSNAQLNKLAPVATKIQEKAIAAYVADQAKQATDSAAKEAKASKETLGSKWDEQLGLVAKARDQFFSPESRAILAKHGNNIHLIQDLVKLGASISEGKLVEGKSAGADKSAAAVLYPSMAT